MNIKTIVKETWDDKFKRYLLIGLILLGIFILSVPQHDNTPIGEGAEIHFFHHPSCSHCAQQKEFLPELTEKYPIKVILHDVTYGKEKSLYTNYADNFSIPTEQRGVPFTVVGDNFLLGFDTKEASGVELEQLVKEYVGQESEQTPKEKQLTLTLPFIGTIDPATYSLPALAIILGFVDGFNPCAMWVLVYLISIILELQDRRKIWLIVGAFVAASGILYFLFMTAWFNAFLVIGYLRPVTIFVAIFALYLGATSVREFITTKGALECKVGDVQSKKKTMSKINKIVNSPLTWLSFLGIIALAFVINSIEFACSSAIPVVFTQVLALSSLSWYGYYGYILLYILFFMLDDLVIFSLAAFAVTSDVGHKYAKWCKLIGGIILFGVGAVLLFAPRLLQ